MEKIKNSLRRFRKSVAAKALAVSMALAATVVPVLAVEGDAAASLDTSAIKTSFTTGISSMATTTVDVLSAIIEDYRGDGFNEKLANLVNDFLNHRDELQADWERLNAAVNDKYRELKAIQIRIRKIRELEPKLTPLVNALLDLIGEP